MCRKKDNIPSESNKYRRKKESERMKEEKKKKKKCKQYCCKISKELPRYTFYSFIICSPFVCHEKDFVVVVFFFVLISH